MMLRNIRLVVASLAASASMLLAAACCAAAPLQQPLQQFEVRLYDAVFRGTEPKENGAMIMVVGREGSNWQRGWGVAREISVWVNEVRVVEGSVSDQELRLDLTVELEAGLALYQAKLSRGEDGRYHGDYRGRFRGVPLQGKAEAIPLPPPRQADADFPPLQPGEHPRILFRNRDLPEVRRRAETPMGQAALKKLAAPVGLGIQYQLTGDRTHAEAAMPVIEQIIARGHLSDQYGNNLGDRLEKTAVTYDLCYDAWPADFKRRVERYLQWGADCVFHGRRDMGRGINWNIVSNWSAPLYAGAGFAGLALWGEKGPAPTAASPCAAGKDIEPAAGYEPAAGVPVGRFGSGTMPDHWLYVSGFSVEPDEDALAAVGGMLQARPAEGTVVEFKGRRDTFRPLSHDAGKGFHRPAPPKDAPAGAEPPPQVIDLTDASERAYFTTGYYYTAISNDRGRWVRLSLGNGQATAVLAGTPVAEGDCVRLQPGLYPLMVRAGIDWTASSNRQTMRPRLTEVDDETAKESIEWRKAEHAAQQAGFETDVAEWKASGGQSVAYRKLYHRGRHNMYVFGREAVGTGGMQGEVALYSQIATPPPIRYAAAHRGMFGVDATPWADIVDVVPRKMFAHVYRPTGPVALEINGYPELNAGFFAPGFPLVQASWQPAVLWAWNQTMLAQPTGRDGVDRDAAVVSAEADPLYTLLHYPLQMTPREPQGIMPLTWQAPDHGFYGFRNAWRGADDCVVQVFLKAHTIGGWAGSNAGTFRVMGLGHAWATGPTSRSRSRWDENVVMLPENPEINERACGTLSFIRAEPDGSGVVSIDYGDVYATRNTGADEQKLPLYERYGNVRKESAFRDSGIRGMRSIGVDYSGRSGATCLLAIVDRIEGGKSKLWMWHVEGGTAEKKTKGLQPDGVDVLARTKTDGDTFTIAHEDGATLRGQFITRHTLTAETREPSTMSIPDRDAAKKGTPKMPGIYAEGGDAFFVVVTLHKGDPPPVKGEGSGLDARVTVGRQKVRFDGTKIVFGD